MEMNKIEVGGFYFYGDESGKRNYRVVCTRVIDENLGRVEFKGVNRDTGEDVEFRLCAPFANMTRIG